MSEPTSGFERWTQLMDRAARDELLTPEEEAFCERFARDNSACQRELEAYAQLADIDVQPDAESRDLVDRALARLEAEDAERAVAEVLSLRPRRTPYWWAAGAVAVVLLGLGVANRSRIFGTDAAATRTALSSEATAGRPLTRAELVYASGDVRVDGRAATAGRVLLAEGMRIETGSGVACVLVDSDINLCLAADSDMVLAALNVPARRIELGRGALATRLSTQPEGQQLTIAAGEVTSTAVGTAFSVERVSGQPVVTTVLNGKVRVAHGAAQRVVNAHERARSDANEVHVSALSRTEEASSWALLGPTVLWHDPVSATLELTGEPAGSEAFLDGQLIGRAPLSSLVPVGAHRLVVRNGEAVLLDRKVYWNAGESSVVSYEAPAPPVASPEPKTREAKAAREAKADKDGSPRRRWQSKKAAEAEQAEVKVEPGPAVIETLAPVTDEAAGPSSAELLRSARRLVREGRSRAAADTYLTLRSTYPDSAEAHTVLVSLAQLQLSALHAPSEALRSIETYLERGGTLSEEARLTRIHALRALRRDDAEAAAIREFLGKHPRSFEDSRLRARLAELKAQD